MMTSLLAEWGRRMKVVVVAVVLISLLHRHVLAATCTQPCLSGVCDDVTGSCVLDWGSGHDIGHPGVGVGAADQQCPPGYHGSECSQLCPAQCVDSVCDRLTGRCVYGCHGGYSGEECFLAPGQQCPPGFHGHDCSQLCPGTCVDSVCHRFSGRCLHGCHHGYHGQECLTVPEERCPKGFHGSDCTQLCSVNCVDGACDVDTGHCLHGCNVGYTDDDCTSVCINGYYGVNCTVPCPEHCQNSTCTPQSGVCSDGCEEGYWGSDCSLGVELSRNSPEEKRAFYDHLSAEGKSVLLYLLTSRYEHALARAQFEIERAVQDRNEIKHILQG